jgi:hypothetical protein
MNRDIENWHIAQNESELLTIAMHLLNSTDLPCTAPIHLDISLTVQKIMQLFEHGRSLPAEQFQVNTALKDLRTGIKLSGL